MRVYLWNPRWSGAVVATIAHTTSPSIIEKYSPTTGAAGSLPAGVSTESHRIVEPESPVCALMRHHTRAFILLRWLLNQNRDLDLWLQGEHPAPQPGSHPRPIDIRLAHGSSGKLIPYFVHTHKRIGTP